MSEKIMVPNLRFKGFDGEWEEKNFFTLTDVYRGISYSQSDISVNGNYSIVRANNVKNGFFYNKDFVKINKQNIDEKFFLKKKDILVCSNSGSKELLGKNCLINKTYENYLIGGFMMVFRNYNPLVLALINTEKWFKNIQLDTFSTINSITFERLKNISFMVSPSLQEQEKIARFFSKMDDLIDLNEKKLETLKKTKKYYLSVMFPKDGESVPQLRFKGFDGEWEKNKIINISKVFGVGVDKKINENEIKGNLVNFVDVFKNTILNNNFKFNDVSFTKEEYEKYRVLKGDILLTPSSEDKVDIGLTSLINIDNTNNLVYSYHLNLIRFNPLNIYPMFVSFLFRTKEIKKYFFRVSQGITRYTLNKENIENLEILFPSLIEQEKIAHFFSKMDDEIDLQEKKIHSLKETKKYYLKNMFI